MLWFVTRRCQVAASLYCTCASSSRRFTQLAPSLGETVPSEQDITDPAMAWLATTKIPELQDGVVLKAAPWDPPPLHIPLTSIMTRMPGEMRANRRVVSLDPSVFAHPIRRDVLHLCIQFYRDGLRQGTASTKTRGEVSGSGKKLRPQKGTGRARLGDRGNPMLRGGGRAFGPKPRDFSTLLPRKMVDMGMRIALTAKLRENALGIVETLQWPGVKTGEFKRKVGSMGWKTVLFVAGSEELPANLLRSSNNLQNVKCMLAKDLTVYDLLRWRTIVMDIEAADWLERRYSKNAAVDEDKIEASMVSTASNSSTYGPAVAQ